MYLCEIRGKGSSRTEKILVRILQGTLLASVVFGAVKEANLVWTLGDIGIGIMAWVNVIAIIILAPKATGALREYESMISRRRSK